MAQAPGMDVLERYGGFQKGNARTNKGGGGKGYAPGGGTRERYTMPPLAQNDEGMPAEMTDSMDFPPQPYEDNQAPTYNRGDNRAPPGSDADFATLNDSDKNDFQTALDYAVAVPNGADGIPEEISAPFKASPEGMLAQEIFKQGGLSESTVQQVKQLWDKFHAQKETIPELPPMPTQAGGGMGDIPR